MWLSLYISSSSLILQHLGPDQSKECLTDTTVSLIQDHEGSVGTATLSRG